MRRSLEEDKTKLTDEAKENKNYNNLLNQQLKIYRAKYVVLSEYLDETLNTIKTLDKFLCDVDDSPNKLLLFTGVDLDSLSVRRRNFKADLDNFKIVFKECCIYEKELYDNIQNLVTIIIL